MAEDSMPPLEGALTWMANVYGQPVEIGPLVQPLITMPDPNDSDRVFVEVATADKTRYRLVFSKFAYNSIVAGNIDP